MIFKPHQFVSSLISSVLVYGISFILGSRLSIVAVAIGYIGSVIVLAVIEKRNAQ